MPGNSHGDQVLVAGSANVDYVVRTRKIPMAGETVLGGDLAIVPGGKGANQAVAAARAGGAATRMLVALGDDAGARLLQASLTAAGVRLEAVASKRPTGAALITVSDDGENAITVASGANAELAAGDLPDLVRVAWLVMQLETPIDTVVAFARAAREAGVRVMVNVAPARSLPRDLLDVVDVLVANEAELAAVTGGNGSIAEQLAATGVPVTIVTLGGRGCCAWSSEGHVVQPAFRVEPVDTTGAGDTFCGVLAAVLATGGTLGEAMRTASAAAALSTTRRGAQESVPERDEVVRLLAVSSDDGGHAHLRAYCGII